MLTCVLLFRSNISETRDSLRENSSIHVAPILLNIMQHMIDIASEQEAFAARELHTLARSYGLHKTPKKRVDEQKKLMAQLLSAYGIEA